MHRLDSIDVVLENVRDHLRPNLGHPPGAFAHLFEEHPAERWVRVYRTVDEQGTVDFVRHLVGVPTLRVRTRDANDVLF